MEQVVRHEGIVLSASDKHVRIKIVQHSSCASCQVSSRCQLSESKEKIIEVFDTHASTYQTGTPVVVCVTRHVALRALLLSFILPLFILLTTLSIFLWQSFNEGIASLLALGSLLPYYGLLWIFRRKIAKTVSFHLEQA